MMHAYLDIETSWEKTITVIGIYRDGLGMIQLVAPDITVPRLHAALDGVHVVCTFNGAHFDLPVIESLLGVNLMHHHDHRDLMVDCRRRKLKGGLKSIERQLGIHRDTEGVDGLQAMRLWSAHRAGHPDALELLLRYNREDCENLAIVAQKLNLFESVV